MFVSFHLLTLAIGCKKNIRWGQNTSGQNAGQKCKTGQNTTQFWGGVDKMLVLIKSEEILNAGLIK